MTGGLAWWLDGPVISLDARPIIRHNNISLQQEERHGKEESNQQTKGKAHNQADGEAVR